MELDVILAGEGWSGNFELSRILQLVFLKDIPSTMGTEDLIITSLAKQKELWKEFEFGKISTLINLYTRSRWSGASVSVNALVRVQLRMLCVYELIAGCPNLQQNNAK
jgi:hypothetical protein